MRVDPHAAEFVTLTLMTEIVMTAFMTESRPGIPAPWKEITNGEALVLDPDAFEESVCV